jgi:hypothetical protein
MKVSEIKNGDRVSFIYGFSDGPIKEGIVVAIKPADVNPPAGHPGHNPATVKIKLGDGQYYLTPRIADLILKEGSR